MRISDWSSDVCSSDLSTTTKAPACSRDAGIPRTARCSTRLSTMRRHFSRSWPTSTAYFQETSTTSASRSRLASATRSSSQLRIRAGTASTILFQMLLAPFATSTSPLPSFSCLPFLLPSSLCSYFLTSYLLSLFLFSYPFFFFFFYFFFFFFFLFF